MPAPGRWSKRTRNVMWGSVLIPSYGRSSRFGHEADHLIAPPTGPERAEDQCFGWSAWVWSPPPESNRRPHPYHGTTGNRCAEGRFPRPSPTVGAKVIGSPSAKLCVLFQTMRWSSLTQATIPARDHKPGRLPTHPGIYLHSRPYHHATSHLHQHGSPTPTNPPHPPSLITVPGPSNFQEGSTTKRPPPWCSLTQAPCRAGGERCPRTRRSWPRRRQARCLAARRRPSLNRGPC
jgi:hypothetical protein